MLSLSFLFVMRERKKPRSKFKNCQIYIEFSPITEPHFIPSFQSGFLHVIVPVDVTSVTGTEGIVEGGTAKLTCEATGTRTVFSTLTYTSNQYIQHRFPQTGGVLDARQQDRENRNL